MAITTYDQQNDRIQEVTPSSINEEIENKMWNRVARLASSGKDKVTERIRELDKEWDIERYLGVNMSVLAISGLAAGLITKKMRWLALPSVVLAFFLQHSIQGWCPPLPLLRKLGIRTTREIELEKYALKFVRGDFSNIREINSRDLEQLKGSLTRS